MPTTYSPLIHMGGRSQWFDISKSTLNNPIGVDGKISLEIISVGHTNFLVKVELTWV